MATCYLYTMRYLLLVNTRCFGKQKHRRKSKMKDTTKPKVVISCRPDPRFIVRFEAAVAALDVRDSDLARKCLEYGFERATQEIAEDKKKKARTLLSKLSTKSRLSFDLPIVLPIGPNLMAA